MTSDDDRPSSGDEKRDAPLSSGIVADAVKEVFADCCDLPPGERGAFLQSRCGNDAELRRAVDELLTAHDGAGKFFAGPTRAARPDAEALAAVGQRIGRYKLLQLIGEGGFGTVYMAEQEEPVRRRVALKIIKLGMDTKQVVARFEAERQALAMMDHENIAKVFDAGATDAGRPYFVMELVRGIPITSYCDQNALSTEDRLDLFMAVCSAVQHAHQKGIIHRDVKPNNVMVTLHDDRAVPKVIDFGVAKATQARLTEKTLFTEFRQMIGTPSYMSPEQAQMSGLDVDTRSDIYSLGVLLYELLTGTTPFDARQLMTAAYEEMQRMIREVEPPRPSTRLGTLAAATQLTTATQRKSDPKHLAELLSGDLDWIVMRCLEKDRQRRYQTATALAEDLQRYLVDQPVLARRPTRAYRMRKFVRRNKVGVLTASAIIAALIIGLGVSTWMFLRERKAHARAVTAERIQSDLRRQAEADERTAQIEAAKSRQVAQFLKEMLNGVEPSVARGRDTTLLREILDKTAERIGADLRGQPEVEEELRTTVGNTYYALGRSAQAEAMHREALAIHRRLYGNKDPHVAWLLRTLADEVSAQGKQDEAEALARETLALCKELRGSEHTSVAGSLAYLALILIRESQSAPALRESKLAEAETLARDALAMHRRLPGTEPLEVAQSLDNLGSVLRDRGKQAEAEAAIRESLAMRKRLLGDEHVLIAMSLLNLADVLSDQGKFAEAVILDREALAIRRKLCGDDHPEVAYALEHLAVVLQRQGRPAEAEIISREALAIHKKMPHGSQPYEAGAMGILADALVSQHKFDEADALIDLRSVSFSQPDRDSAALFRALGDGEAVRGRWRQAADRFAMLLKLDPLDEPREITLDHSRYAPALIESGDLEAYERYRQDAVARFAQTRDPTDAEHIIKLSLLRPGDPKLLESLKPMYEIARLADPQRDTPTPWAYLSIALLEYRRGDYAKSVESCGKNVAYGPYGDLAPRNATAHVLLAMSFHQMHRNDEAQIELEKAREPIEAEFKRGLEIGGDGFWFDWVIPRILLREADHLILIPATTHPGSVEQSSTTAPSSKSAVPIAK